jgi:hypothetical protein
MKRILPELKNYVNRIEQLRKQRAEVLAEHEKKRAQVGQKGIFQSRFYSSQC